MIQVMHVDKETALETAIDVVCKFIEQGFNE